MSKRTVEWDLALFCCGHDDGHQGCATWDEADRFRRFYIDAGGHDRAAILTRRPVPRGWRRCKND